MGKTIRRTPNGGTNRDKYAHITRTPKAKKNGKSAKATNNKPAAPPGDMRAPAENSTMPTWQKAACSVVGTGIAGAGIAMGGPVVWAGGATAEVVAASTGVGAAMGGGLTGAIYPWVGAQPTLGRTAGYAAVGAVSGAVVGSGVGFLIGGDGLARRLGYESDEPDAPSHVQESAVGNAQSSSATDAAPSTPTANVDQAQSTGNATPENMATNEEKNNSSPRNGTQNSDQGSTPPKAERPSENTSNDGMYNDADDGEVSLGPTGSANSEGPADNAPNSKSTDSKDKKGGAEKRRESEFQNKKATPKSQSTQDTSQTKKTKPSEKFGKSTPTTTVPDNVKQQNPNQEMAEELRSFMDGERQRNGEKNINSDVVPADMNGDAGSPGGKTPREGFAAETIEEYVQNLELQANEQIDKEAMKQVLKEAWNDSNGNLGKVAERLSASGLTAQEFGGLSQSEKAAVLNTLQMASNRGQRVDFSEYVRTRQLSDIIIRSRDTHIVAPILRNGRGNDGLSIIMQRLAELARKAEAHMFGLQDQGIFNNDVETILGNLGRFNY